MKNFTFGELLWFFYTLIWLIGNIFFINKYGYVNHFMVWSSLIYLISYTITLFTIYFILFHKKEKY